MRRPSCFPTEDRLSGPEEGIPIRCKATASSVALATVWVVALLVLTSTSVRAQVHRITNPVDSYLWWTLSEEITPSELKRQYSDLALSLVRYEQAVEASLESPFTEDQLRRLTFYINHELTPELAPMWWAFDIFSRQRVVPRRGRSDDYFFDQMTPYGISRSGIDKILVAANGCAADRETLMADLGPKQIEAQLLIWERLEEEQAGKAVGRPIMESVNERRYDVVASETGRKAAEIRELVDALADWEAPRRLVAACLPELKQQLAEEDWRRFQAYLQERIIAPLGGLAFYERGLGEGLP